MFFKNLMATILVAALFWNITGCIKWNEKAPPNQIPDVDVGSEAECFAKKIETFKDFADGSTDAASLTDAWNCLSNSLATFKKYVHGANTGYYTPQEVSSFFEKYYLKNITINDTLLAQLMKVKVLVVGGTEDKITTSEIDDLMSSIQGFEQITLDLLPYMKLYTLNWQPDWSQSLDANLQFFEQANTTLQTEAHALAAIISKNGVSYDLQNIKPLLVELQKIADRDWEFVDKIDTLLPLFYNLKATLAGGDLHIVAPSEWDPLFNLGSRGLVQFLRLNYFVKDNPNQGDSTYIYVIGKEINDLMDLLSQLVSAKATHQLTRAELMQDFESFSQIFTVVKVSDEFVLGALQLKQLLFGGSVDYLTNDDFENIKSKLSLLQNVADQLDPYLDIYATDWNPYDGDPNQNMAKYLQSEAVLESALNQLASQFEGPLDIENLKAFLVETNNLYPTQNKINIAEVLKFFPLAESLRSALFGDPGTVVQLQQWPLVISGLSKAVGRGLQYHYFIEHSPYSLRYGFGLEAANSLINETLKSLGELFQQMPSHQITVNTLISVGPSLTGLGYLPSAFQGDVLKNILTIASNRFLTTPEARISGQTPNAINQNSLNVVQSEWNEFYSVQKYLADQVFADSDNNGVALADLQSDFSSFHSLSDLATNSYSDSDVGLGEMKAVFQTPVSRAFDEQSHMQISFTNLDYKLTQVHYQNIARALGRLLMRCYAKDLSRIQNYQGINEVEWSAAVDELTPPLVVAGVFGTISSSFAQTRFIEMNLFTPRADGNNVNVSFIGISDFVLNVLSGYNVGTAVTHAMAPKTGDGICPATGSGANTTLQVSCVADYYFNNYSTIFESMPVQAQYVAGLSRCPLVSKSPWIMDTTLFSGATAQQLSSVGVSDVKGYLSSCSKSFDVFIVNLLLAADWEPNYAGEMTVGDTLLVPHALQYIEVLMQRYDADHSGYLGMMALNAAYPLFKPTLQFVTANIGFPLNDTLLKGVLAYLMQYGEPPATTGLVDKAKFGIYAYDPGAWKINTDRTLLGSVLGAIAEQINATAGK